MSFTEGRRACCNAVIVTKNHLRFVTGRHIACKRRLRFSKSQIPLRYLLRSWFEADGVMEFGFKRLQVSCTCLLN